MWRAVMACMLVGCVATTWQGGGGDPRGEQAFIITRDRAAVVENTAVNAGRVGGHVVRMWKLPPPTEPMIFGDTPSETARRSRWIELPPGGFFASEPANVQAIQVTRLTAGTKVAIGVVCALGGLTYLALSTIAPSR